MAKDFQINVRIGSVTLPMPIERSEEELIRKAAKMINETLDEYSKKYKVDDREILLSMTALNNAVELLKEQKKQDILPILNAVAEMEKEIEAIL